MNTQLGSTIAVVSGCFVPTSAAPVAGRSLAGQASIRASPRYKVSPMVVMIRFLMRSHKGTPMSYTYRCRVVICFSLFLKVS